MSDTPIQPWTLKNVPPEQRNAAIKAAQQENQPVGVWAGRVLFEAAQKVLTGSREVAVVPPPAAPVNGTAIGHLVPTETQPAAPLVPGTMAHLESMLLMSRIAKDLNDLPPDGPAAAFQKAALAKLKAQLKVS